MKKNKKIFIFLILFLIINIFIIDFVSADTYNNIGNAGNLYSCGIDSKGVALLDEIPPLLPKLFSIIYNIIQIAIPVILVVMGSFDLMRGITAGKEEDIKKGQTMFIKRLIAGVLVFFVFVIVKFVIGFVADSTSARILDCAECFVSNKCSVPATSGGIS